MDVVAKELRIFDGVSRLMPLLLQLYAGSFPHLEDLGKLPDVFFTAFRNANVPTVVFRNMETKRVRTNHGTHADVAVPQEHAFEIRWSRLRPY